MSLSAGKSGVLWEQENEISITRHTQTARVQQSQKLYLKQNSYCKMTHNAIIRLHVTDIKQKLQSNRCPWKLVREKLFVWNYRWPWEKVSPSVFILPSLMEWNDLNAFRSNKYLIFSPFPCDFALFLTSMTHLRFPIPASTCKMTQTMKWL